MAVKQIIKPARRPFRVSALLDTNWLWYYENCFAYIAAGSVSISNKNYNWLYICDFTITIFKKTGGF